MNKEEEKFLTDKLSIDKNSISEEYNYALGSSSELIGELLNENLDNGACFLGKNNPSNNAKNDFEIVSLITKLAIEKHNLKRVLIIDWDKDHNLNLQKIFYDNAKVLNFSIHCYKNGVNPMESTFNFTGEQTAKGLNANITLEDGEFGNTEYMSILYNILLPIAYEVYLEKLWLQFLIIFNHDFFQLSLTLNWS